MVLPSEPPEGFFATWKGQNPERWPSSHFRYLLHCEVEACSSSPGIKTRAPEVGARSPTHWATRRRPERRYLKAALVSCSHDRALSCPAGAGGACFQELEGEADWPLPSAHFASSSLSRDLPGRFRSCVSSRPLEQRAYLFHLQACLSVVQLDWFSQKPFEQWMGFEKTLWNWVWAPSLVSACPSVPAWGSRL